MKGVVFGRGEKGGGGVFVACQCPSETVIGGWLFVCCISLSKTVARPVITESKSLDRSSVEVGDVIMRVGGLPTRDHAQFRQVITPPAAFAVVVDGHSPRPFFSW